jgi:excisionase family DNA binding protein
MSAISEKVAKSGGKSKRINAKPKEPPAGALLDTVDQTARLLGIARASVYQLIKEGKLETVIVLSRSRRVVRESTVKYIEESRERAS